MTSRSLNFPWGVAPKSGRWTVMPETLDPGHSFLGFDLPVASRRSSRGRLVGPAIARLTRWTAVLAARPSTKPPCNVITKTFIERYSHGFPPPPWCRRIGTKLASFNPETAPRRDYGFPSGLYWQLESARICRLTWNAWVFTFLPEVRLESWIQLTGFHFASCNADSLC